MSDKVVNEDYYGDIEIISEDYYSNCLIEAVKTKLKNWKKIKITYISPFNNFVFCPHVMWSDGINDYDFGNEVSEKLFLNWTIHKGHIRKQEFGHIQKYKETSKKWPRRKKERIYER